LEKQKYRMSIQNFVPKLWIYCDGKCSRIYKTLKRIKHQFVDSIFMYLKIRLVNYYFSVRRIKHFCLTWIYHQPNAQIYLFNNNITSWSSTCFEHRCAHLQEDNCIFTISGIVSLCMLPYSAPIKSELQWF
jgi:hypothetical protein